MTAPLDLRKVAEATGMTDTEWKGDLETREDGVDVCPSCRAPLGREPDEAHEDTHWDGDAYRWCEVPTDALDRIAANLPVSYGELAAVDPARCPSSPDRRGPHRPDDTTDPLTCAECGAEIDR